MDKTNSREVGFTSNCNFQKRTIQKIQIQLRGPSDNKANQQRFETLQNSRELPPPPPMYTQCRLQEEQPSNICWLQTVGMKPLLLGLPPLSFDRCLTFLLNEGIVSLIPQYLYAGGILCTIREFLRLLKLVLNPLVIVGRTNNSSVTAGRTNAILYNVGQRNPNN